MHFGMKDETHFFLKRLIDAEGDLTIIFSVITQEAIDEAFRNGSRKVTPEQKQVYKVYFESYIMYQTRDETLCAYDPDEIREGYSLILFEKSRLLDNLLTLTPHLFHLDEPDGSPGKWRHYGIYTQNSIVDVISQKEPIIEALGREDHYFPI